MFRTIFEKYISDLTHDHILNNQGTKFEGPEFWIVTKYAFTKATTLDQIYNRIQSLS